MSASGKELQHVIRDFILASSHGMMVFTADLLLFAILHSSGKSMENQAIVATGLTKWFGEGDAKMTAVNGVELVANFGEMLFIVGPSGSAKITLLSMISGILRPNAGTVTIKRADIWTLSNDQLADFRLNTIGFVFQDYHLFPRLTSAENVAIPLILKQLDWDESITEAKKYLEIVGLKGRAEMLSSTLPR